MTVIGDALALWASPAVDSATRVLRNDVRAVACSCLNFETACAAAPQPDPRSHAKPEWNSVKIYGLEA